MAVVVLGRGERGEESSYGMKRDGRSDIVILLDADKVGATTGRKDKRARPDTRRCALSPIVAVFRQRQPTKVRQAGWLSGANSVVAGQHKLIPPAVSIVS